MWAVLLVIYTTDFNNALNKAESQALKLLYNARAYIIMRASYDSIDN